MLSKIERGQLFPTLPTLLRIALLFGVGLEHFFVDGEGRPTVAVARKRDRLRMPDRPGAAAPAYFFESLDYAVSDRKIQAFYAEFPEPAKASEPHRHDDGAELVYVLQGRLVVNVGGEDTALDEGDAMYFDPRRRTATAARGRRRARRSSSSPQGPGRDQGGRHHGSRAPRWSKKPPESSAASRSMTRSRRSAA
jgi:mannose-6-phosphate isomerase-like protein (cupin superfamily)